MARGQGTVTVKFLGDTSSFEKATEKVGGGLKKLGGGFAAMGKAAAIGFAAAGAAAIPFGIKAVQLASDVEESLSKVNSIFGKTGGEIDKWAKGAASSLGLSRGAALEAAGSFGNMFLQLGIGAPQAAKMSKEIVGLAADFASFHNADISEVIAAQSAAFRGEYDSLQRFLPLINAATVEQKAMEMTGKANAKALTAQEKALAVQKLMLEGAGKAQGDFARTSGGLANQMRILKANAENFAAGVGQVLLPIVLKGIRLFGELSGMLKEQVAPAIQVVERVWGAFQESLQGAGTNTSDNPIVRFAGDAGDWMNRFSDTVEKVWAAVQGWFDENRALIMEHMNRIAGLFSSAFGAIRAVVTTAVDFLRGVWRVFGDDLTRFAREAWAGILETFRGAINMLTGIFDLIKAVLTGRWGDAWTAVKKIVDGAWDTIFGVFRNAATNIIPTILAGLGQAISSAFRTAFDGLKEPFKAVLNWMIDRINDFVKVGLGPLALANKIPGLGSVIPNIPKIPRLAGGGTFSGAAVVGEAGPELLVGAGRVVPNNQLGGVTNNFYISGAVDKAAAAREIEQILTDFARQGGALRFT